jgi:hypothetical protein
VEGRGFECRLAPANEALPDDLVDQIQLAAPGAQSLECYPRTIRRGFVLKPDDLAGPEAEDAKLSRPLDFECRIVRHAAYGEAV